MAAIFYISLFVITVLLLKIKYRNSEKVIIFGSIRLYNSKLLGSIWIFIAVLPIILFLMKRIDVGTDYNNYLNYYDLYIKSGYRGTMEPGVIELYTFGNAIGLGYQGFLFCAAIISVFVSAIVLKTGIEDEYFPEAMFFFLCLFFGPICNIMSQMMALPFIVLAYIQMLKNKTVQAIVLCCIAMVFHTSAIILIPLFLIMKIGGRRVIKVFEIMAILAAVVMAAFPSLLQFGLSVVGLTRYAGYFSDARIKTFMYLLIYRIPLYFIEALFYRDVTQDKKEELIDSRLVFLIICEASACIVGIGIGWVGRLVYYFSIAHVLFNVRTLKIYSGYNRTILKFILILYYLAYFVLVHFYSEFDSINHISLFLH